MGNMKMQRMERDGGEKRDEGRGRNGIMNTNPAGPGGRPMSLWRMWNMRWFLSGILSGALMVWSGASCTISAQEPDAVQEASPNAEAPNAEAPVESLPGSVVVAVVGNEPILLSDLRNWSRSTVAEMLPTFEKDILPGMLKDQGGQRTIADLTAEEREEYRNIFMVLALRQMSDPKMLHATLDQFIETKRLLIHLQRSLPADTLKSVRESCEKNFEEKIYPTALARKGVKSKEEMDQYYQRVEVDPDAVRRIQLEINLTQSWLSELQTKEVDTKVSYNDQMRYYQSHLSDFTSVARARWEQLMARTRGSANRDADIAKLAKMGNAVMEGEGFAEVAKRESDGPTSVIGGVRDWTRPGTLRSVVLDRAIFSLPVGAMSPVLEDEDGFHIVRVIEREDAVRKSFGELQDTIREKIIEERTTGVRQRTMDRLRSEITVRDDRERFLPKISGSLRSGQ